jgi:nicotinate dehydrogenase subunit B
MTSDPRARAVIERVAALANWRTAHTASPTQPTSVAAALPTPDTKLAPGYFAVIANIRVDYNVRVEEGCCAADCGMIVNPDGVRNQIGGGLTQSISWTLKEQVRFEDGRIASREPEGYPILRFSEVPEIEIALLDRPDAAPLGAGEIAQGPMAAAIANAVRAAIGSRIRDLPLTRDRILAAT